MHTFLVHIANYWITDKLGFDTDKLGRFPNNSEHFGTSSKKTLQAAILEAMLLNYQFFSNPNAAMLLNYQFLSNPNAAILLNYKFFSNLNAAMLLN